ncbi:MAG TPA: PfkB family carbohydrate kinase, partial [Chloroflexota bacterium]
VVYDPQGRVLHLGHQHREAWDFFRPSVPRSWTATPWVLLTGVPPERQVALRRQISPSCHVAVDSLARWIQESPGALRAAAEGAAVLALNHVEAELFTGRADPQAAACALVAVGARWGLVKCGGEGAVLAHHRGVWHVPAYPARFLDGTGAGDTLLGAMIGWLDAHMARHVAVRAAPELDDPSVVLEAVAWGTAAASFTVEGLGPERLLTARRDEMEARVAPIRRGIRPLGPYRV